MKIAFLTTEYPHPRISAAAGIATSIRNLAEALVKKGVSVSVIVANQKKLERFSDGGIDFHLLPLKKYRFLSWFRYRKYMQEYINEMQESIQWDLLEAPDWTGITAFMKLKMPIVIRLHGSDSYFCKIEGRRQNKKHFLLESIAVKHASAIISPSAFTAKVSAEVFGIPISSINVIHYGLALDRFTNPSPDDFQRGLILCSGTLIRKKGSLELPGIFGRVLEQYPDAELLLLGGDAADVVTGSPSTWKMMQQMMPEQVLKRVHYEGRVGYDRMQEYIRKAHVCVFPTFAETLGMVTIEAMAMQKAVVNSNIGWANEIIDHGESGLMAHPSDHKTFADHIVSILKDDELRKKLGVGGLQRVRERFDISKTVKQNIELYQKVAG